MGYVSQVHSAIVVAVMVMMLRMCNDRNSGLTLLNSEMPRASSIEKRLHWLEVAKEACRGIGEQARRPRAERRVIRSSHVSQRL